MRSIFVWLGILSVGAFGLSGACSKDQTQSPASEPVVTSSSQPKAASASTEKSAAEHQSAGMAGKSEAKRQPKADNTARNKRDQDSEALTPGDQSNTQSDLDITAAIRRSVVRKDGLSTNARNVKIITRDGHVTLRGPVASREEREFIDATARSTDGVRKVDNLLEVVSH